MIYKATTSWPWRQDLPTVILSFAGESLSNSFTTCIFLNVHALCRENLLFGCENSIDGL